MANNTPTTKAEARALLERLGCKCIDHNFYVCPMLMLSQGYVHQAIFRIDEDGQIRLGKQGEES